MDDVVGNLGEPLDFAEYHFEDDGDSLSERESGPPIDGLSLDAARESLEGPPRSMFMDVDAAGSSKGGGGGAVLCGVHSADMELQEVRNVISVHNGREG